MFERNDGQHASDVRFAARGDRYQLAFLDDRLLLSFATSGARSQIGMRFASSAAGPRGESTLAGAVNYLIGSDPHRWRTNVPVYERVRYARDGIDLIFYGSERRLEYDVVIAAGVDPRRAWIAFDGVDSTRIRPDGSLALGVGGRELTYTKPVAYQVVDGGRRSVRVAYRADAGRVTFDVGDYDRTRELVIDPVLVFSTYLGGSASDWVYGVAVDAAGATYVAGVTASSNYPTSVGALQGGRQSTQDAVVTKLDRSGALVYSTYFGGNGADDASAIAVDPTGAAYIAGSTTSSDLAVSANAFQRTLRGHFDGYVLKLQPSGNRIAYLTYLGGGNEDIGSPAIAVDSTGIATVVGTTTSVDFPTTAGAWMEHRSGTAQTGFATRLNASGSGLLFSTFLTGTITQFASAVALDSTGRAVVAGAVLGPMTTTASIGAPTGNDDAFVLKLNAGGTGIVFSTRIGGSAFDNALAVGIDTVDESIVVAGETQSPEFPTSAGAPQTHLNGSGDAYVLRLAPQGNKVIFSTLLGGSSVESAVALDVTHDDVTVFGYTNSTDFPLRSPLQSANSGQLDAFVTRLRGGGMLFSSYLGGSAAEWMTSGAVDGAGAMTLGGYTYSGNYPTAHAVQPAPGQAQRTIPDGFISRASLLPRGTPGPSDIVVHVVEAATLHGNWFREPDAAAAGGALLHNPDAGAPKLTAAIANPTDYFEFTLDGVARGPYMLWIRGKADGNAYTNDSVYVQFSNAFKAGDGPDNRQVYRIGTTEGLAVSIEDCSHCGLHGWGWQDGGYGRRVPGPRLYFRTGEPTTIRVQRREDGVSIDQIVLASDDEGRGPYFSYAPGYQKDDDTIVTPQGPSGGGNGATDIVIYAAADGPVAKGLWSVVSDATAAGGARMHIPDAGAPKLAAPIASPADYFELTFQAKANVAYRLWMRGRADDDYWGNDSAFVQFQGSVTGTGAAIWRIGTASATTYSVENCTGCGLKAWGWNDNAYEGLGPVVYFAEDGDQTIRVQRREDGLSIDQIVLSPAQYIDRAPGAARSDTVIVPR